MSIFDSFTGRKSETAITGIIYLPNGTRIMDKDMREDYHSGGTRSEKLRMMFEPRKPTRLFRFHKDGLPASKGESVYVFNQPDPPIERSLRTVLQIEAAFRSAKAGVNSTASEAVRQTLAMQRILLVSSLIFLAACGAARLAGFTLG